MILQGFLSTVPMAPRTRSSLWHGPGKPDPCSILWELPMYIQNFRLVMELLRKISWGFENGWKNGFNSADIEVPVRLKSEDFLHHQFHKSGKDLPSRSHQK